MKTAAVKLSKPTNVRAGVEFRSGLVVPHHKALGSFNVAVGL